MLRKLAFWDYHQNLKKQNKKISNLYQNLKIFENFALFFVIDCLYFKYRCFAMSVIYKLNIFVLLFNDIFKLHTTDMTRIAGTKIQFLVQAISLKSVA